MTARIAAYLEIGSKRAFAGALDWPGWCRSGRPEERALAALVEYGPRYARVVGGLKPRFVPPIDVAGLDVVERLPGDATTNFGAPAAAPGADAEPVGTRDATRLLAILGACWSALDAAVEAAAGRELVKGPRGGGRSVEKIVDHVVGAEGGYLARIGRRFDATGLGIADVATASLGEVEAAIRDGVPPSPRGGKRWTVRYFVRRSAWHILDHAWEIEDRTGH
ncbi:MAG TPA: hypothetical protein VFI28_00795 [Candidatus Limnocylindrales bacterium]|nr:hypothetical protein [Candidatus Limnocylindrales bacterium]